MNVKELIEQLQKYNDSDKVVVNVGGNGDYQDDVEPTHVYKSDNTIVIEK